MYSISHLAVRTASATIDAIHNAAANRSMGYLPGTEGRVINNVGLRSGYGIQNVEFGARAVSTAATAYAYKFATEKFSKPFAAAVLFANFMADCFLSTNVKWGFLKRDTVVTVYDEGIAKSADGKKGAFWARIPEVDSDGKVSERHANTSTSKKAFIWAKWQKMSLLKSGVASATLAVGLVYGLPHAMKYVSTNMAYIAMATLAGLFALKDNVLGVSGYFSPSNY